MSINLEELKKVLKPLIKSCIKEVILEEKGILSHIINETLSGSRESLLEEKKEIKKPLQMSKQLYENRKEGIEEIVNEGKKRLSGILEKTGNQNLKHIFEGMTPITEGKETKTPGPLSGIDANDAGVDISSFFNFKR